MNNLITGWYQRAKTQCWYENVQNCVACRVDCFFGCSKLRHRAVLMWDFGQNTNSSATRFVVMAGLNWREIQNLHDRPYVSYVYCMCNSQLEEEVKNEWKQWRFSEPRICWKKFEKCDLIVPGTGVAKVEITRKAVVPKMFNILTITSTMQGKKTLWRKAIFGFPSQTMVVIVLVNSQLRPLLYVISFLFRVSSDSRAIFLGQWTGMKLYNLLL